MHIVAEYIAHRPAVRRVEGRPFVRRWIAAGRRAIGLD